jgi:molybdopterin-guanine dinucleotide biosynthesis protein A
MKAITGIILAGGKSRRMGTDKGLMPFCGKPMIEHIIGPMAKVCQRMLVVTSNEKYTMFGLEIVKDEQPDYGPVMGILSGLRQSTTELNLILSCDTPFVGFELMNELVLKSDQADVFAACSRERIHPLIAVYKRRCISTFENSVLQDEHRLRIVLKMLKVEVLDLKNERLVRNINAPEDL